MNKFQNTKSLYIKQYANNNILWHQWSKDIFIQAKQENKPIFLSIGTYTCKWSQKMRQESFLDEQITSVLNKNFISVIVDKDERPDITMIYLQMSERILSKTGWPLNLIMTPNQKPFFVATYLTKDFLLSTLQTIFTKWKNEQKTLEMISETAFSFQQVLPNKNLRWNKELFSLTFNSLQQNFDLENAGFFSEPKMLLPHFLMYLLYYYKVSNNKDALNMGIKTLSNIFQKPIFDQNNKGFWRLSKTKNWQEPYLEKTLFDNAMMAITYFLYYWETKDDSFKEIALEIISFLNNELLSPDNIYFSKLTSDDSNDGDYLSLGFEVEFNQQHNISLTSNAVTVWLYAKAYMILKKQDYLTMATSLLDKLLTLFISNKQIRICTLDSYAFLVNALIEVYYITYDEKYLKSSIKISDEMIKIFYNHELGNFYYTPETDDLIIRPQVLTDLNHISANSMAINNLTRLKDLTIDFGYDRIIKHSINNLLPNIYQSPLSHSFLILSQLSSQSLYLDIIIICNDEQKINSLKEIIYHSFHPYAIINFFTTNQIKTSEYFNDYETDSDFILHLCEENACLDPIEDFDEAIILLKELFS